MLQCPIYRQTIAIILGLTLVFGSSGVQAEALSLEEAYRLALITHERIGIAGQEVKKSELLPKKALSIMLPHANIDGSYVLLDDEMTKTTRSHLSAPPFIDQDIMVGPTVVALEDQVGATFTLRQSIYRGEFFPLRKAATHKIEHSRESLFETIQGIFFDVATVYYEGVTAKALIKTSEEMIVVAQNGLDNAHSKVNAGKLTEDAVHLAQLNVSRAERQLIIARQRLKFAKDVLGRFTGQENAVDDIVDPTLRVPRQDDFDALLEIAYANRFDLKVAKINMELARDDLDISKSKNYPVMDAEWKYFWYNEEPPSMDQEFWAASVKLSVPLFEGGARTQEVREKTITQEQVRSAYTNLTKDIRLEVEESLLMINVQEATLDNIRQQVEAAKKNHQIISARYEFGAATSLENDQAFAALNNARTQLDSEIYNYQMALLKLEKVLGVFNQDLIKEKFSKEKHGTWQEGKKEVSISLSRLALDLTTTSDFSWGRASVSSMSGRPLLETSDSRLCAMVSE